MCCAKCFVLLRHLTCLLLGTSLLRSQRPMCPCLTFARLSGVESFEVGNQPDAHSPQVCVHELAGQRSKQLTRHIGATHTRFVLEAAHLRGLRAFLHICVHFFAIYPGKLASLLARPGANARKALDMRKDDVARAVESRPCPSTDVLQKHCHMDSVCRGVDLQWGRVCHQDIDKHAWRIFVHFGGKMLTQTSLQVKSEQHRAPRSRKISFVTFSRGPIRPRSLSPH